jgi:hypothetical protein
MVMIVMAACAPSGSHRDDGEQTSAAHHRCTPTTCAANGATCGSIPNGCGQTLSCGACSGAQTCGGGGTANQCGGGGPVLLLHFDEPSGATSFADASGSSSGGACNTGVSCPVAGVPGRVGGAIQLDGAADFVDVPGAASNSPASAVAAGAFVLMSSPPSSTPDSTCGLTGQEVISRGDSYALEARPDGNVRFFIYDTTGSWDVVDSSSANVADGSFHHVLGQKTDTALEVYVDGALAGSAPFSGTIAYTLGPDLLIGRHGNGCDRFFAGTIDEATVYARSLSAGEIAALAAQSSPAPDAGVDDAAAAPDAAPGAPDATALPDAAPLPDASAPPDSGSPPDSGTSGYSGWITGYWYPNGWVLPASSIPWSKYTHMIHHQVSPLADGSLDFANSTFYTGAPAGFNYPEFVAAGHAAGKQVLWGLSFADCSNTFISATSPPVIATLVNNVVSFTTSNGYDGVEVDWECAVDVGQYEDLLRRIRAAMPDKALVIALQEGDQATVAAASASVIDQANLMCYDQNGGGPGLWYNASIYGDAPSGFYNSCSLALGRVTGAIINWWGAFTSPGVPISKIGIGAPFYGRRASGCTLAQQQGCSDGGPFTYRDLVSDPSRWQPQYQFYDATFKANYLSIPSLGEFDSFSGPEYMRDLVAWGKAQGAGGFMTFTVEDEYLSSKSGDARYPLSTALYDAINSP